MVCQAFFQKLHQWYLINLCKSRIDQVWFKNKLYLRYNSSSLVVELQEKLQEEKAKLQLEEQEKRKNEEMQSVQKFLIAEQQTNFNTILTREKMGKENIINDLSDKLKNTMQQQEQDKDLIKSLSEDCACLLEEKKRLEEEVSRLWGGAFVPSPGMAAAPKLYGACAPEPPVEALDTLGEGRPDSAMETSMMSVPRKRPRALWRKTADNAVGTNTTVERRRKQAVKPETDVSEHVFRILEAFWEDSH